MRVPGWPEKATLGAFVVHTVQKEYPSIFSQRANFAPSPHWRTVSAAPVLQASLRATNHNEHDLHKNAHVLVKDNFEMKYNQTRQ